MAQQRKFGLGKGLSALLDDTEEVKRADRQTQQELSGHEAPGSVNHIPVSQIEVNPFQPRADFDEQALDELAASIRLQGLIQPITIRKVTAGSYQLISCNIRTSSSTLRTDNPLLMIS